MIMKKNYLQPKINIIEISEMDIVTTSNPFVEEGGEVFETDAPVRRNAIWDDYE